VPESAPPPEPPPPSEDEKSSETFEFKNDTSPPAAAPPPPSEESFDDGLGELSFKEDTQPPSPPPDEEEESGFGDISFGEDDFADGGEVPPPDGESAAAGTEGMDDDFGDFDFDEEPASFPGPEPAIKTSTPDLDKTAVSGASPQEGAGDADDFDFDDFSDFSDGSEAAAPSGPDAGHGDDDFGADFDADFDAKDLDLDVGGAGVAGGGEDVQEFGEISFDDIGGAPSQPAGDTGAGAPGDEIRLDMGSYDDAAAGVKPGAKREREPTRAGGGGDAYAFEAESSEIPETEIPVPLRKEAGVESQLREEVARKKVKTAVKAKGGSKKIFVFILLLGALAGGGYYMHSRGMLEKADFKEKISISKIREFLGIAEEKPPQNIIEVAPVKSSDLYRVARGDGKTLWVIEGSITNLYSTPQWMILLEGKLLDNGEIRTASAMYGNILSREQLSSFSLDSIQKLLRRTEDENLNTLILLPEQSARYMIVFDNVESDSPRLPKTGAVIVKEHHAL